LLIKISYRKFGAIWHGLDRPILRAASLSLSLSFSYLLALSLVIAGRDFRKFEFPSSHERAIRIASKEKADNTQRILNDNNPNLTHSGVSSAIYVSRQISFRMKIIAFEREIVQSRESSGKLYGEEKRRIQDFSGIRARSLRMMSLLVFADSRFARGIVGTSERDFVFWDRWQNGLTRDRFRGLRPLVACYCMEHTVR